jgi:hypothetical protein
MILVNCALFDKRTMFVHISYYNNSYSSDIGVLCNYMATILKIKGERGPNNDSTASVKVLLKYHCTAHCSSVTEIATVVDSTIISCYSVFSKFVFKLLV